MLTTDGFAPFIAVSGQAAHVIFVSNRDGHKAIYNPWYELLPSGA